MTIFGYELAIRRKGTVTPTTFPTTVTPAHNGGWFPIIYEWASGFWQRNLEVRQESVLAFYAVYACVTLIASDIGKLRIMLVAQDADGIWEEVESPAFSPVLRKPNRYQIRIRFLERWMLSKLIHGNTYVLKQRDQRGIVVAMYVLDPLRVRPLVAPDGSVFYQLGEDNLAQINSARAAVAVPASEIIHDMMPALYHDLCGVSPLSACGIAAMQGLRMQSHGNNFFANGARPGGILTAPGIITDDTAKRLQENWEANFTGANVGKVAVLGDGLTYQSMSMNAVDAQLIEQLKMSAEAVCSAFKVPAYKVGIAPPPAYNNIEALNLQYYSDCLQNPIESIELLLDEGVIEKARTPDNRPYGTELDRDALIQMDTLGRVKAAAESIGSGAVAPNEARKRWLDLGPVTGGDSPMMQQQVFSLDALDERDRNKPFAKPPEAVQATPARRPADMMDDDEDMDDMEKRFELILRRELT